MSLCMAVLLPVFAGVSPAAESIQAPEESIRPGRVLSRMLGRGETRSFTFELESGDFARLVLTDSGLHPLLVLEGPGGEVMSETRGRTLGRTSLSLISRQGGTHRLEISAPSDVEMGYPLKLHFRQRHPATSRDASRVTADHDIARAGDLRDQWREEQSLEAIEIARRALDLYGSIGDQIEELWSRRLLADVHYRLVQDDHTLRHLEAAVELSRTLEFSRLRADLEISRGLVLIRSSRRDPQNNPLEACREALRLSRESDYLAGEARAQTCLGEYEYHIGNVEKAIGNYTRARHIWQLLPPQRGYAETLLYLATAFSDIRDVVRARETFNEAFRLWRLAADPRGQTLTRLGQGALAVRESEHQQALEFLTGTLPAVVSSGDPLWRAVNSSLLGYVYFQLGEPARAVAHYREALPGFADIQFLKALAETHMEMGRAYRALGKNDQALEHFGQGLDAATRAGDRRVVALVLQGTGQLLETLGDLRESQASYRSALCSQKAEEDPSGRAETLIGLGRIQRSQGDLEEAARFHQEALQLGRAAADCFLESQSLYYLSLVERDQGNIYAARSLAQEAIVQVEELRTSVDDLRLRATYFATVQDYYRLAIDLAMQMGESKPGAGYEAKALHLAERARARSLLESLVASGAEPGEHPPVGPLTLEAIQAGLDEKTALLEYALGADRSFLWVITGTSLKTLELPAEAEITEATRNLYDALTARGRTSDRAKIQAGDLLATKLLGRLGRTLLPPASAELAGKRLVIVPDGSLYYVPFAALLRTGKPDGVEVENSEELRPLILDHELARLPSASALSVLKQRARLGRPGEKSIAVIADPVFEADDPRLSSRAHAPAAGTDTVQKPAELLRALRDVQPDERIRRLISSGREARAILDLAPPGTGLLARGFEADRRLVTSGRLTRIMQKP